MNTYFDSTKNDSNDQIGGFGLGIKSVFSYSSSFMINCFDGTTKRIYAYKVGAKGLPEISLMAELHSSEQRGVEICIPAKKEDYKVFEQCVIQVLSFYDTKPEVIGLDPEKLDLVKVFEGTTWAVYRNPGGLQCDEYVEMGNVIYPATGNMSDEHDHLATWQSAARSFLPSYQHHRYRGYTPEMIVVHRMVIGQVDITPNREQLKFTTKTIDAIKASTVVIRNELRDQLDEWVAGQTGTIWEVATAARTKLMDDQHFFYKYGVDINKLTYKGTPILSLQISYGGRSNKDKISPLINKFIQFEKLQNQRYSQYEKTDVNWNGITFSSKTYATTYVIVAANGFTDQIAKGDVTAQLPGGIKFYILECDDANADAVVANVNSVLVDCDQQIVKWSDLSNLKVKKGVKVSRYDVASFDRADRYNSYESNLLFSPTVFKNEQKIHYVEWDYKFGGKTNLDAFTNSVCYYDVAELMEMLTEFQIKKIYRLPETLIKYFQKNGVELIHAGEAILSGMTDTVTNFIANNVLVTLVEFVAPLRDRNTAISENTFARAIKYWAKLGGRSDIADAVRKIEKNYNWNRNRVLRVYEEILGKTVLEFAKEKGIAISVTADNSLVQTMLDKAPVACVLVTNYNHPDVVKYICNAMGWTIPADVKVKKIA